MDDEDFYNSPEYAQLMQDNPAAEVTDEGPTDVDVMQYLDDASNSGLGGSLIDNLKKVWSTGGKAIDGVGAFAKANPGLTSMFTAGVGTAMSNKQRAELAQQQNQYQIDKENRAKADAKELWDRRNQSIIATEPAKLGILGSSMLDKHAAYLKNRKNA